MEKAIITKDEYVDICMAELATARKQWIDLPAYVYTDKYEEAFRNWCTAVAKAKDSGGLGEVYDFGTLTAADAERLAIYTLHHETGIQEPYFDFERTKVPNLDAEPMEPDIRRHTPPLMRGDQDDQIEAYCPSCCKQFWALVDRCGRCGQAIKWPKDMKGDSTCIG